MSAIYSALSSDRCYPSGTYVFGTSDGRGLGLQDQPTEMYPSLDTDDAFKVVASELGVFEEEEKCAEAGYVE